MRKVAVIGASMGRIGRYPELMFQDLGWPAVKGAIEDAGLARNQIEAVYCGSAYGGRLAGQRVDEPVENWRPVAQHEREPRLAPNFANWQSCAHYP